jgi:hypothetical protein
MSLTNKIKSMRAGLQGGQPSAGPYDFTLPSQQPGFVAPGTPVRFPTLRYNPFQQGGNSYSQFRSLKRRNTLLTDTTGQSLLGG